MEKECKNFDENVDVKKNSKKKKVIKIIVISLIVLLALIVFAPILIMGGFLLVEIVFNRPSTPKVKHGEFPFELVYEYNGEQHTISETIICDYEGVEFSLEGGNSREWNCYMSDNTQYGQYYLDEEKYPTLHIQIPLEGDYWMGDPEFDAEFAMPYLFFVDENTGTTYYEKESIDVVGAKIISWKPGDVMVDNIK